MSRCLIPLTVAVLVVTLWSCQPTRGRGPSQCSCKTGMPDEVLWIDTDIGQDVDDLMALVVATQRCRQPIVGVSTTMVWPKRKAQLVRVVLDELGRSAIPVYSGRGLQQGQEASFARMYPQWPHQYGDALHKERRQREALEEQLGVRRFEEAKTSSGAVKALLQASRRYPGRVVVLMLGPLTNLAAALRMDAGLSRRLKLVVAMGGWYAHGDGSVRRPSYNTAMDLEAARRVFADEHLPLLLVNSQALADAQMRLQPQEYRRLVQATAGGPLARAVQMALVRWAADSGRLDGRLALADPVTALMACDRSRVAQTTSVSLYPEAIEGVHLKHPRAAELLRVKPLASGGAGVRVVTRFDDAPALRAEVVETLRASIEMGSSQLRVTPARRSALALLRAEVLPTRTSEWAGAWMFASP